MLNWNANKVKNLTGTEIWLFIIARILIGFGAGTYFAKYYPQHLDTVAITVIAVGIILLAIASLGMKRKNSA